MTDTKDGKDWGPRTARQWLAEFGWKLPDPTEEDVRDLDRMMEHDEFWQWSSGKVEVPVLGNTCWRQTARNLLMIVGIIGGLLIVLSVCQRFLDLFR